jgi:hypothetical protein
MVTVRDSEFKPLDNLLAGTSDFRPFAYYDKHLDAIRVQIMDCSVCEDRLDRFLTVYHANYPVSLGSAGHGQIVGFVIKGISHLFESLGLKTQGVVRIAAILDAMVKTFPAASTKLALEVFGAWPEDKPREVKMSDAA